MIAKCPNCNFVRISQMRKTCPHCRSVLTRPAIDELRELSDSAMDRVRAAGALVEAYGGEYRRELSLAAFMATVEGRHMTLHQAREMLS
jgi:hypothetical protein